MIFKTFKILRNHPKKIIFFTTIVGFGVNYAKQKYEEECLMRAYCHEALKYGQVPHKLADKERHVTVILNPAANGGKGKSKYEKYCAPLLHLSGMKVALVRTEHEDQARQIMDVMDNTSAVIVAGGDGTLSEILTGLFRREDAKKASQQFPLGILPLGESNTTASSIWGFNKVPEAKHLAEATMAIVRNWKRSLDVMEITPFEESDGSAKKPVYAASQIEWGAFRDARERKSDYWYWAFLKKYMVYVFSSYKDLSWNCGAEIDYCPPCKGCSKCKEKEEKEEIEAYQKQHTRWWQAFVPRSKDEPVKEEEQIDYTKIINDECGMEHHLKLDDISDVRIMTKNTLHSTHLEGHTLGLKLGKKSLSGPDFIKEGCRRERGDEPSFDDEYLLGEFTLKPNEETKKNREGTDRELNIDSETFEIRTIRVRPKPSAATIFAPPLLKASS